MQRLTGKSQTELPSAPVAPALTVPAGVPKVEEIEKHLPTPCPEQRNQLAAMRPWPTTERRAVAGNLPTSCESYACGTASISKPRPRPSPLPPSQSHSLPRGLHNSGIQRGTPLPGRPGVVLSVSTPRLGPKLTCRPSQSPPLGGCCRRAGAVRPVARGMPHLILNPFITGSRSRLRRPSRFTTIDTRHDQFVLVEGGLTDEALHTADCGDRRAVRRHPPGRSAHALRNLVRQ